MVHIYLQILLTSSSVTTSLFSANVAVYLPKLDQFFTRIRVTIDELCHDRVCRSKSKSALALLEFAMLPCPNISDMKTPVGCESNDPGIVSTKMLCEK